MILYVFDVEGSIVIDGFVLRELVSTGMLVDTLVFSDLVALPMLSLLLTCGVVVGVHVGRGGSVDVRRDDGQVVDSILVRTGYLVVQFFGVLRARGGGSDDGAVVSVHDGQPVHVALHDCVLVRSRRISREK